MSVQNRINEKLVTLSWMALLFIASFALYARTMAPGLLDADEGEFQVNIYKLGVSHTGYPTFFMLGKLWTMLIPVGTIATRANLFSVFWGSLTIAATYGFIRWLTRNHWAGILSALLLLGSRVEWSQAIIPRPYTLNSLFVVLVTFFFFLWRVGKVDLIVPVFVFGASLTNHRTMMWFAPAIALFVLVADYRSVFGSHKPTGSWLAILRQWITHSPLFKPRRFVALIVAFVLPLFAYAYVFWRGDSDVGVEFHLKDFNEMILGGNANRWMYFGGLDWIVSRITNLYLPLLIEQFTPLGFIAGLVGMLALAFNRGLVSWNPALPGREALVFILLANAGNSLFCVFFNTMDVEKFFLPSYITFLFLVGVGIAVIGHWLDSSVHRLAPVIVPIIFVGATIFLLINNFTKNDFSQRTSAMIMWDDNLSQPLERNALIVGSWESLTPLEYAQYVDGRRTDLERWKVIVEKEQLSLTLYGSRQEDIERAVRAGRPVYLTVHPKDTETLTMLADEFRLVRVGELWRVLNLPPRAMLPASQPVATFTDREGRAMELVGYSVYPATTLHPGDFGLLTLFWRAPQSLGARLTISLRVMDEQDRVVYQRDMEPATGLLPTIGWLPNEIIQDDAGFFIPPDVTPGKYRLALVVYNPASGEELMIRPDTVLLTTGELQVVEP